jgi:hypothetical protein
MSFWEQFLLAQASSAMHAVIARYAGKYFTPEELQATTIVLDALIQLPERIHSAIPKPSPTTLPGK